MAYSDHVGHGHQWRRTHYGDVRCQCGLPLPFTASKPVTRDLIKQRVVAAAMDVLASEGMIKSEPGMQQERIL